MMNISTLACIGIISLEIEKASKERNGDWDEGYLAGLKRAIWLIEQLNEQGRI